MLLVKQPRLRSLQSMLNTINSSKKLRIYALALFIVVEDARVLGGIRRGYKELGLELIRIPKLPAVQPVMLCGEGEG